MISLDTALRTVMRHARPLGVETVPLGKAHGRVLARPVASDTDLPPADMSAMDGYACRRADLPGPLRVVESVAAGQVARRRVGPGRCVRIMTGAPLPRGADTVVMLEDTRERNGMVYVERIRDNPNVRRRAEDVRRGQVVLRPGTLLTPPCVAVLAAVGRYRVPVFRRPRVAVIATGDELVEPRRRPGPGQIRNSNGPQLCAQVTDCGAVPTYIGIARDTPEALLRALRRAAAASDVVVLSGGVSAGDHDHVRPALRRAGVRMHFESIAIKPGRPTVFGTRGKRAFFGLPGNPVSTFVLFESLVRPYLCALMGLRHSARRYRGVLAEEVRRRKTDRTELRPVAVGADGSVAGVAYHGSAHIHAYTVADGFITVRPGVERIARGVPVEVTLLR